jgi:prepilin-type processing-associated H-X9-DG protein
MKQIALALSQYEAAYGSLPPVYTTDATGRPLHSWRALILPFLDQRALYDSINFTKPWDDPENDDARGSTVSIYRCPEISEAENTTTYLAVVGTQGCFVPGKPRALGAIWTEDQSPMLLIEAGEEEAVPWMSPSDADEKLVVAFGSESRLHHSGGTNVAFGDGSVQFMANSTPVAEREKMIAGPRPAGNRKE